MISRNEQLKPDTRIHNPTQCRVVSTVTVSAPADRVWAVVGDFAGFHTFIPALESIQSIGSGPGEVRIKQFKDGNVAIEQLNSRDDNEMHMTWTLIHTSLPVGQLWAAMTVEPAGGTQCTASWTIVADPVQDSGEPLTAFQAFLQAFADSAMRNVEALFE